MQVIKKILNKFKNRRLNNEIVKQLEIVIKLYKNGKYLRPELDELVRKYEEFNQTRQTVANKYSYE